MMVDRFEQSATSLGLEQKARALGRTPYDIVKVASLIEREVRFDDELPKVAQVVYNRLEQGETLGIDAAILYGLGRTSGALKQSELDRVTPYNLRKVSGPAPDADRLAGREDDRGRAQPDRRRRAVLRAVDQGGPVDVHDHPRRPQPRGRQGQARRHLLVPATACAPPSSAARSRTRCRPRLHRAAYAALGLDWPTTRSRSTPPACPPSSRGLGTGVGRAVADHAAQGGGAAAARQRLRARRRRSRPPTRCSCATARCTARTPTSTASSRRSPRPAPPRSAAPWSSAAGRPRAPPSPPWRAWAAATSTLVVRSEPTATLAAAERLGLTPTVTAWHPDVLDGCDLLVSTLPAGAADAFAGAVAAGPRPARRRLRPLADAAGRRLPGDRRVRPGDAAAPGGRAGPPHDGSPGAARGDAGRPPAAAPLSLASAAPVGSRRPRGRPMGEGGRAVAPHEQTGARHDGPAHGEPLQPARRRPARAAGGDARARGRRGRLLRRPADGLRPARRRSTRTGSPP